MLIQIASNIKNIYELIYMGYILILKSTAFIYKEKH